MCVHCLFQNKKREFGENKLFRLVLCLGLRGSSKLPTCRSPPDSFEVLWVTTQGTTLISPETPNRVECSGLYEAAQGKTFRAWFNP